MRTRLAIATGAITLHAVAVGMCATQNYLAKYNNASGALVDSGYYAR